MKKFSISKIILVTFGSILFVPVSCTLGSTVGVNVISYMDKRDIVKGDEPHSDFRVAAFPGENGKAFKTLFLSELESHRYENNHFSFTANKMQDRIDINDFTYLEYNVVDSRENYQKIEVAYEDDDGGIWSLYEVKGNSIKPISSRIIYFGFFFATLPYAFAFSFLFFLVFYYLRIKYVSSDK